MHPVVATTPTQYAFAVCFLIVGPVLATLAASAQHARGKSPLFGAFIVGGVSWAGWIIGGVAAAFLYPTYPASGTPSEPVAILFLLPGLMAGGFALGWLVTRETPTRPGTRNRHVAHAALVVGAVLFAGVAVWTHVRWTTWPGRRELPDGAEILEERVSLDTGLGDFEYEVRARMPEASFREWMRRLGVAATADPARYGVPHDYVEHECGSQGTYLNGIGVFHAWCS